MNDNSVFTVTYKILSADGKLKWDLKLKASTAWSDRYRFTYEYFTIPCEKTTIDVAKQIVFTYAPSYNVTFFYDDVNQAEYPVSEEWDSTNHKHYFSINLGIFSVWQTKQIDPNTVATSSVVNEMFGPNNPVLYTNGYWWATYTDGTNQIIESSGDGADWVVRRIMFLRLLALFLILICIQPVQRVSYVVIQGQMSSLRKIQR